MIYCARHRLLFSGYICFALLCFALQLVLDFVLLKCVGRSLHDFVFLNLILLGGRADTYLLALPNEGQFRFRRNVPAKLF